MPDGTGCIVLPTQQLFITFTVVTGPIMRMFSQALKPFIPAFLKSKEPVASAGKLAVTTSRNPSPPLPAGVAPGDAEALLRRAARSLSDAHNEQATRARVVRMYDNLFPVPPTHTPDLARMRQLQDEKKINAMFSLVPPVPTHVPQFKAASAKASVGLPMRPDNLKNAARRLSSQPYVYRSVSAAAGRSVTANAIRSQNGRALRSKREIEKKLVFANNNIAASKAKIAVWDMHLARTSDPALRLRIVIARGREQLRLTQQKSNKISLNDLARRTPFR